ncbi:hypothetical protein BD414DRAFT_482990 [Trametes punicea]|nr:hypothetical protein BD414DRAFT_482990 [Trametes punicea]
MRALVTCLCPPCLRSFHAATEQQLHCLALRSTHWPPGATMPASGDTHTFAKRGLALEPPFIAGIIAVVLLFNVILAVSFCALRRRRRRMTHKGRVSAPVDCETSVAFTVTTGAVPAMLPTKAAQGAGRKSYFELIQALQQQPRMPSPTRLSRGSSQGSADEGHRLSRYVLLPRDIKGLDGVPRYPKAKGRVQNLRQSAMFVPTGTAVLTRSNSFAETASVYSSASAPLEYHEHLFRPQPFALDPNPPRSAPARMSQLPAPPAPVVISDAPEVANDIMVPRRHQPSPKSVSNKQGPHTGRRSSHPDVPFTPTVSPSSTDTPGSFSRYRSRANSNPHSSPPRVAWLASKEADSALRTPRRMRTSSDSSLLTPYPLRDAQGVYVLPIRPVRTVPIMPLRIKRRSEDLRAAGRTEPYTPAPTSEAHAMPTVPARSPRRPAASGPVEQLP